MRVIGVACSLLLACGRINFDPTPTSEGQLSVGNGHACAIRDGALYCWGGNSQGQLGIGTTSGQQRVPARVGGDADWIYVSAANESSCGIREGGALYCWGAAANGKLGNGDPTAPDTGSPLQVGTDAWTSVSCQENHCCGIQRDGSLWCWGDNSHGQLGEPSITNVASPLQFGTDRDWLEVGAGSNYNAGRSRRGYVMWGSNEERQRGDDSPPVDLGPPALVELGIDAARLSVGREHTCATDGRGGGWCWGDNRAGQIGVPPPLDVPLPHPIDLGAAIQRITAGGISTCALAGGSVSCWGDNTSGQLGRGTIAEGDPTPVRVGVEQDWTTIVVGIGTACGERDGEVYCWGGNASGAAGGGSANAVEPSPVGPLRFDP